MNQERKSIAALLGAAGGRAAAKNMTKQQRIERARKASQKAAEVRKAKASKKRGKK